MLIVLRNLHPFCFFSIVHSGRYFFLGTHKSIRLDFIPLCRFFFSSDILMNLRYCLTKIQSEVCEAIVGSIGCQINKGTNVITISVTDTDARVAACMADSVKTRLQNYITLYRTKKARQDLAYSQQINAEAKAAYEKSRQKYASFADANSEVVLMSYQSKLEDLENDMQLKFNNYSQTAQQVQKAQAKIQENTPAFTVIQNATVPLKSSSMPRTLMVIIFVFVGVIADALWVLVLSQAFGKKK